MSPVRLNVTSTGTLIALTDTRAVVQLAAFQSPNRQTTLTIDRDDAETLHLAARVTRTVPYVPAGASRWQHHVLLEFMNLSPRRAEESRRLINTRTRAAAASTSALLQPLPHYRTA